MAQHRSSVAGRLALALGLTLASFANAQDKAANQSITTWRGTWLATAAPNQMFRGRWWASAASGGHNAAGGSWTLLSDSNAVILEGTWSAKKSAQAWQGTWSARTKPGTRFSGTWTSNVPELNAKTFEDLLTATTRQQVAGSWQARRLQGSWSLQGP